MGRLYVGYAVTAGLYYLIVQVAEAGQGYKALFILLDYVALTYLFFFNSWFRNAIAFPIAGSVETD